MISLTKIFRFEAAHAIYQYSGLCKNIHGHSYKLLVTVINLELDESNKKFGFVMDFKELKLIVSKQVIDYFDHHLVVSEAYLNNNISVSTLENIIVWKVEPSAENILIFVQDQLEKKLPQNIKLLKLQLFETADSFVEWTSQ